MGSSAVQDHFSFQKQPTIDPEGFDDNSEELSESEQFDNFAERYKLK